MCQHNNFSENIIQEKTYNPYVPNTSSIPNIIFDYWQSRLSLGEFSVLMCIARKTYGWHKTFDRISLSRIEKQTGLSRYGIIKIIDSLVTIGLILKIKTKSDQGDDAANAYEINTNCLNGGSQLSLLGVVNGVDQGVVNYVDPQKKTNTKENIQKRENACVRATHLVAPAQSINQFPKQATVPASEKPNTSPKEKLAFSPAKNEHNIHYQKQLKSKDLEKKQPALNSFPEPQIPSNSHAKKKRLSHVLLTDKEYNDLLKECGQESLDWMLNKLNSYILTYDKQYSSHYGLMIPGGWVRQALNEQKDASVKRKQAGEYQCTNRKKMEALVADLGPLPATVEVDFCGTYVEVKTIGSRYGVRNEPNIVSYDDRFIKDTPSLFKHHLTKAIDYAKSQGINYAKNYLS